MKIAVAHRNEVTQYAAEELAKYVRLITRCEIMPSVEYLEQPFICEGLEDTLVLGLCEGEFPKNVSDSGVLNTPEREILSELGVELSANSETKSSDELLFVKRAFSLHLQLSIQL